MSGRDTGDAAKREGNLEARAAALRKGVVVIVDFSNGMSSVL